MTDTLRQKFISDKMVSMWAKRFLHIRRTGGVGAAHDWANRTLNKEDVPLISKEIERLNGTGGPPKNSA